MALAYLCPPASAAELQLHAKCSRQGGVILLGDIVEIHAADAATAARLATIEISPAPPPGEQRFINAREVRDLLVRRGVDIRHLTFSGASQVEVSTEERIKRAEPVVADVNDSQRERAKRIIEQRLAEYLNQSSGAKRDWRTSFTLDDDLVRLVLTHPQDASIQGGGSPWTGPQQFAVSLVTDSGLDTMPLSATVTLPATVVVAARSLPREGVIRPTDVRLEPATNETEEAAAFGRLEDVVGHQTTRSVGTGQPITAAMIRPRVLVRRGNIVSVYVRSPGIEVRTIARAKQDGSQAELIELESLSDRATFFGSVSGIDEVEVFARADQARTRSHLPPQEAGDELSQPVKFARQPTHPLRPKQSVPASAVSAKGVTR